jgi:2,3-diketo-5-methylthiopentyl-1-phosphate enolase
LLPYFDLPFDRPESLGERGYVLATYIAFGLAERDVLKRAGGFATGQTVGTWLPLPGVTRAMVENHQARVVGCYPIPQYAGDAAGSAVESQGSLLRIAFPVDNFGGSLAMLLVGLVGNDVSTAIRIKLIDLEFVGGALRAFSGPKQGIAGFRRLTGVKDRPLILNMLKPCLGYSPETGADLFYESGRGGVDLIKDDEVMGNTTLSGVEGRVKAYLRAAKRVEEETGRSPVYIVNITDRPSRMRENARVALTCGAQAVMVNFVTTGLDSLAELACEFGDSLCFLGHYAGVGALNAPTQGIGSAVMLGILPRMAGADAVMIMHSSDRQGPAYLEYLQTVQAHRLPLAHIKQTCTTVGGGITPLNVAAICRDLGPDTILGVGGAVQGHPGGAAAGAKAILRAVEAAVKGIPLQEAASDCPELQKAIEVWS